MSIHLCKKTATRPKTFSYQLKEDVMAIASLTFLHIHCCTDIASNSE